MRVRLEKGGVRLTIEVEDARGAEEKNEQAERIMAAATTTVESLFDGANEVDDRAPGLPIHREVMLDVPAYVRLHAWPPSAEDIDYRRALVTCSNRVRALVDDYIGQMIKEVGGSRAVLVQLDDDTVAIYSEIHPNSRPLIMFDFGCVEC